ncbi:TolC family outer membrane protein [bacterium]|nr:TolC family outer membrane protein [bacterium]
MKPVAIALIAASMAAPAFAQTTSDTLGDAVSSAFDSNPDVLAERKTREVAGETLEQARSFLRPSVSLTSGLGAQYVNQDPAFQFNGLSFSQDGDAYRASVGLQAQQTLYGGGGLTARTRQAEAGVDAASASLIAVEQSIILGVIRSYLDVRRSESVVDIRESNVAALRKQVEAATDRFDVGEVTRTDVAQSQARLAGAEANLAAARAGLQSVRAEYERLVGRAPVQLAAPPPAPAIPRTVEEAFAAAIAANPQIVASRAAEEAARHAIDVARGDLRPRVTLSGNVGLQETRQDNSLRDFNVGVAANLTFPLYSGGLLESRTRQARLQLDRARLVTRSLERQVTAAVASAWYDVIAARQAAEASRLQVAAAELALEGTEQELAVGSRITLDVLDQEQELLEARLGLINAEQAAYLAVHRLLALSGGLSPALFDR